MGDFDVHHYRRHDATVVVSLRGELDTDADASLQGLFAGLLDSERPSSLIVDMRHVTFLDTAGVRALVVGHLAARALGMTFQIRHPKPMIEERLRLAGIDHMLMRPDDDQERSTQGLLATTRTLNRACGCSRQPHVDVGDPTSDVQ